MSCLQIAKDNKKYRATSKLALVYSAVYSARIRFASSRCGAFAPHTKKTIRHAHSLHSVTLMNGWRRISQKIIKPPSKSINALVWWFPYFLPCMACSLLKLYSCYWFLCYLVYNSVDACYFCCNSICYLL